MKAPKSMKPRKPRKKKEKKPRKKKMTKAQQKQVKDFLSTPEGKYFMSAILEEYLNEPPDEIESVIFDFLSLSFFIFSSSAAPTFLPWFPMNFSPKFQEVTFAIGENFGKKTFLVLTNPDSSST